MKLIPLLEKTSTDHLLDGLGYPDAKYVNSGSESDVYDIGGDIYLKIGKREGFDYGFYRNDCIIKDTKPDHFVKVYRTGEYKGHQWSIKQKVKPLKPSDVDDVRNYLEEKNDETIKDTQSVIAKLYHEVYTQNKGELPQELSRWQTILDAATKISKQSGFDVDAGESNIGLDKNGKLVMFDI